jgi:hypothetical protein
MRSMLNSDEALAKTDNNSAKQVGKGVSRPFDESVPTCRDRRENLDSHGSLDPLTKPSAERAARAESAGATR